MIDLLFGCNGRRAVHKRSRGFLTDCWNMLTWACNLALAFKDWHFERLRNLQSAQLPLSLPLPTGGFLAMQTLPCKEWKNFFRTPGLGGFSVVSSRIQLKSLQKVLCTGVCDPTNTRYLNSRNLKFRLRSNAQNFKRFFNFPLGNRVQLDMIKSSNNAICGSLT